MFVHYKRPLEALLVIKKSQQCKCSLVPPFSVLSRLKKTLDGIACEDRILKVDSEESQSAKVVPYLGETSCSQTRL